MSMDECTLAVRRFCGDLGMPPVDLQEPVVRFELADASVLQLERQAGRVTLWLSFPVHAAMLERVMLEALRQVHEHQTGSFSLRCGLLADERLVLFMDFDERGLTEHTLHEAYRLLSGVHAEVLAA
ncbi:type III secretion chaperone SycN [Pseudomonas maumuensis]|uniref:Type III secretion chaperone SycN n=1 Tax=Pseudomonas maumuensis TaxID=2842354 RepID=A0ABX8NR00_9PSED|nr:type III secretion chaperone SycN [Pseudomonas maumuensis]QXH58438.1 type III secretion chaperone SycN [Pseudomonas maumuensis]